MDRALKILIILITGLVCFYRVLRQADHTMILDEALNYGLAALGLVVLLRAVLSDRRDYRRRKNRQAFVPTGLCLLIGGLLLITYFLLRQRDRSPVRLSLVTQTNDFNGLAIDFREDGTYKLTIWSIGADYYRGTYSLSDSIITLNNAGLERTLPGNRLLIRAEGEPDSSGNRERFVYPIDASGRMIPEAQP